MPIDKKLFSKEKLKTKEKNEIRRSIANIKPLG
jgi:hypothetical protein